MCGAAREVKAQDLSGFGKFVDLKFEHFWEKVPHAAPFLRKGRRKALAHIPSGLGIEGIFWVVGHSRRRAKHDHCTRLPFGGVLLAVSSFIGPVVMTFCFSLVLCFRVKGNASRFGALQRKSSNNTHMRDATKLGVQTKRDETKLGVQIRLIPSHPGPPCCRPARTSCSLTTDG